jgi:uncharacterized OB-fold protein
MATTPLRIVPVLDALNAGFWTAGREKELRLRRCQNCRYWVHPPRPLCPRCHQRDVLWEATSGKATLFTFTLNHKAWNPAVPVPYVIGMVELPEQAGLRLTSNIVNCSVDEVHIGMPLCVTFEQQAEFFIPVFEPETGVEPTENVTSE